MKTLGIFLGLVAIAALAFYGYQRYNAWDHGRLVQWRADSAAGSDSTRAAVIRAMKKDTAYLRARGGYVVYRDRILGSGTATPRDSQTFGKCDEVQRTCDERHAADSVEKASLRRELAIARARPTERPKRFTIAGEGLYDLLNAAPVFRAGADLRLFGPISAKAEAELAIPSAAQCAASQCGVRTRALVGIRYVF